MRRPPPRSTLFPSTPLFRFLPFPQPQLLPARSATTNAQQARDECPPRPHPKRVLAERSEEHTSELQSLRHLVCRLLLEKKKGRGLQHLESAQPDQPAATLRD